jgi:hypothetical protein
VSAENKENQHPEVMDQTQQHDPGFKKMYIAQNARLTLDCVECRKPRVVYSQYQLTERQKVSLVISFSQYDYICGAPILPPAHFLVKKATMLPFLSCAKPMEIPYYSANLGRKDLCGICGIPVDMNQKYKFGLPICDTCIGKGKSPISQRPYGASAPKK